MVTGRIWLNTIEGRFDMRATNEVILRYLADRHGQAVTIGTIASDLGMHWNTAQKAITRLEGAGLVRRERASILHPYTYTVIRKEGDPDVA